MMTKLRFDAPASLMRVAVIETSGDAQEELIARGALFELVGTVLQMRPEAQRGLLLRVADADDTHEYDVDAIRELAARPEFTDAYGAWDTAERADDPDRREVVA
jgi:hypothetical protein